MHILPVNLSLCGHVDVTYSDQRYYGNELYSIAVLQQTAYLSTICAWVFYFYDGDVRRAWLFPILLAALPLLLEIPPSAITLIASIVASKKALIECEGKMNKVFTFNAMLVFFTLFFPFTSVRLISRKRQNLSTVLPPPPISPLNMVKDVAYNREFNMMYLLIDEEEIWVYYTRYSLSNGLKG